MIEKNAFSSPVCDHCNKKITTNGERFYSISTSVWHFEIGEDMDERLQFPEEPISTIELESLCYECLRDLQQVLENGKKKIEFNNHP